MKAAFSRLLVSAVLSLTSFVVAPFKVSRLCHRTNMGLSQSSPAEQGALSTDGDLSSLSQRHEPYTPPHSHVQPAAHYIFLVHGWLGNDLEMGYLADSFVKCISDHAHIHAHVHANHDHDQESAAKRVKRNPSHISHSNNASLSAQVKTHAPIRIHSVKCNVGKTHDGIKNGGTRLAHEIIDFIRSDWQHLHSSNSPQNQGNWNHDQKTLHEIEATNEMNGQERHVTYSIVGNSLGGLYARYAISLIPRQLSIPYVTTPTQEDSPNTTTMQGEAVTTTTTTTTTNDAAEAAASSSLSSSTTTTKAQYHHSKNQRIHLHPNVFCTTATPHLGVSQHTYLPLPRFAETIIGSGMGTTGRDLFRLNSDKNLSSNSNALMRRWSSSNSIGDGDKKSSNEEHAQNEEVHKMDEEMECIIRNMCLQDKYLTPLRNFRKRIAYANAYRTDFQVPTETAAFLNSDSEVEHIVVAARGVRKSNEGERLHLPSSEDGKENREENMESRVIVPPFVVAVVRTEQQQPQSSQPLDQSSESATPSNELLRMSQSLDALGWTKVFIDVRNRIPLPGIPKPSWRLLPFPSPLSTMLPTPDTSLDDLIHNRASDGIASSFQKNQESAAEQEGSKPITVTSHELVLSTNAGETLHFPLGHTVMVANSKSETYSKLNFQGRPVMDRLAEDMMGDVLMFSCNL